MPLRGPRGSLIYQNTVAPEASWHMSDQCALSAMSRNASVSLVEVDINVTNLLIVDVKREYCLPTGIKQFIAVYVHSTSLLPAVRDAPVRKVVDYRSTATVSCE